MTALEEWDEKRGVKGIDYEAMKEAAKQHAEEEKQTLKDDLRAMREQQQKKSDELYNLLAKAQARDSEQKRLEMERKQKAEAEEAAEAIRQKYAKESPAEWNDSPARKALRGMLQDMKVRNVL